MEAVVKRCPKCDAIALSFGKDHCTSDDCDWFTCLYCGTTYHRAKPIGFLNRGKTMWHSNTKADT
jgi:hypothetical protein